MKTIKYTGVNDLRDYEYIKDEIKKILTTDRFIHSLGVEKEAVKLAKTYGADIEKCRIAAIVHDSQKCLKDEDLIKKALEYNIELDKIQLKFPQLLHGPVGAIYCKRQFNIKDEDIFNAVYYHTTGRENMSLIEKIIYIADIIEENREYFKGLEKLRKKAYKDLDEALIMSADSTIKYIIKKGFLIHPLTIEFRNSLLLGVK